MASGSFESSTGTNLEIGCEWTSTANQSSNTSSVRVRVYLSHYEIYSAAIAGSYVSVGDKTEYFSIAVNSSDAGHRKTYIADKMFEVTHNTDGSKNVQISAGWVFNGTYSGTYISTLTVSKTVTLDKIARASDFTLPSQFTIGESAAVTVAAASSSYRHRVLLSVGAKRYTGTVSTGQKIIFTPPESLAEGMTSAKRGSGNMTLETYNGSTKIGEKTKSCVVVVPERAPFAPTFTLSFSSETDSSFLEENGIICAKRCAGAVSVSGASAKYGASVASCRITFGTQKYDGYTADVGALSAGEISYSAVVTDTRGIKTQKNGTVTVLPYFEPYADGVEIYRCLEDGTKNDGGSYLSARAAAVYAPLEGDNSATVRVSVSRRTGSGAAVEWNLENGVRRIIPASLSATSSYIAVVKVTDSTGSCGTHSTVIPTSRVDLHIKNGKIRFGGYVERDGFECDYPARFSGGVYVDDEELTDFIVDSGRDGIWEWRRYSSGASECFGTTDAKSYALPISYGALYRSNQTDVGGNSVAYPAGLFVAPPTVNATAAGSRAVLIAPRTAGSAAASPDYYIIYCASPEGGVECALHLSCRGRWKT